MAKPNQHGRDSMRVDWFRVLQDLKRREYSVERISRETGIPRTTIREWVYDSNRRARFEDGIVIVQLWCNVTALGVDQLPWVCRFAPFPALGELAKSSGNRQRPEPTMPPN